MLLGKFVNLETGSYHEARLYLNSWLSSCLRLLIVGITGVYPRHPAWALLLNDIAKCSLVVCWSGVREDNYALSYRGLGVSALLSLLWPGKGDELGSWILPLIPVGSFTPVSKWWPHPLCAKHYRAWPGKSLLSLTWRSWTGPGITLSQQVAP